MDFRIAQLFLFLYYIRPQDWIPGLSGFNIIRPIIAIWFVALYVSGSSSPLKGILKTPHDWAMVSYYIYVGWTAPDSWDTYKAFFNGLAFYLLHVQSISSWDKLLSYLRWWNWLLVAVASIATLSLVGIDFTGAVDRTAAFKGRLCIGTYIHNNPNALGHTVIAILPLSYLLYFWKGTTLSRMLLFPLCIGIAGWCAWETQSKGAFMVGAIITLLVFVFGRPKYVQISAISAAAILGVGALSFLPRMSEMSDLSSDEGVQGRVMAWDQARNVTRTMPNGVGYRKFMAFIQWRESKRVLTLFKATHSSYVQIGADLGKYGLAIFLACLWMGIRAVGFHKSANDDEERCRRTILILLVAYCLSSWMINREYHTEYFVIIALSAAYHRLRLTQATAPASEPAEESVSLPNAELVPTPAPLPVPALATVYTPSAIAFRPAVAATPLLPLGSLPSLSPNAAPPPRRIWNRIGFLEIATIPVWTWLVFWYWDYTVRTMLW